MILNLLMKFNTKLVLGTHGESLKGLEVQIETKFFEKMLNL